MRLSPYERETYIWFSDENKEIARIYTCQPGMMRRLAKHPLAKRVERHLDNDGNVTGERYKIPRECIRIIPGKKRNLSDAQRAAARERMKRVRTTRRTPVVADDAHPGPEVESR